MEVPQRGDRAVEALERALHRAAGSDAVEGNRLTLLIDGPETYKQMHAQIDSARHRIHLENYIFHDDDCGKGFAERLIARAREGIKVRVLYDWVGSSATGRKFWRSLRDAGAEVRAFGPPSIKDPLLIFARDHRKVLVVDGEKGVTGGLCIGNEWCGDEKQCREPWRDTAISIEGPGARVLDAAFRRAWVFAGGREYDDGLEVPGDVAAQGDSRVRVVATEPGRERAFRTIDLLLGVSERRIWVSEAYLAAPQRMYQAFIDAARDGVDVRLLLPSSSDLRMIRNLSRSGYRALLRAGVRIFEWNGPMLHAKTIVADGRWVRIGSSNLNPSSLLANWEVDVFSDDRDLAQALERQFLLDLEQASEVLLRPRRVPVLFGREVPPALDRQRAGETVRRQHVRTFRERRQQAIVTVGGLVRGARAAIFGPVAAILLLAAVLFALFPVPMAWTAAGLSAVAGCIMAVRALGHRARA